MEYERWVRGQGEEVSTFTPEYGGTIELYGHRFSYDMEPNEVTGILDAVGVTSDLLYDRDNQSAKRVERKAEGKSRLAELREKRRNAANGTTTKDSVDSKVKAEALPDKK